MSAVATHIEDDIERWTPRELRKCQSLLDNGRGTTWWAPGAIGWWVGVLFAIGATLFAVGAAPDYSAAVGRKPDLITFFVGSIFFTTAALLQFVESMFSPKLRRDRGEGEVRRLAALLPRDYAWWASLVQLAGTIYFNYSTLHAIRTTLSGVQADKLVWKPDAIGSVCFLVASLLCWFELGRPWQWWRPRSITWWIVALNIAGSVGFGLSSLASYVVPATGNPVDRSLVNLGTFVGAVCFLVAAVLLLPERTRGAGRACRRRGSVDMRRPLR